MGDTSSWSRLKSEIYSLLGRNPKSNRMVTEIASLEPTHVVLDVGCGPGAAVRAAAGSVARAVGVDRSEPMIAIARRRSNGLPNVEFATAGAEDLPFPDATFDRVWTIHAFHHWEDSAAGIAQCLRVLKPGGRLLIVESETSSSHGLDETSAAEVADTLRVAGFASASVSKPGKQLVVTGVRGD
jgi:ubiquinone/menaquinone biosynthesis C-methylase UbiE